MEELTEQERKLEKSTAEAHGFLSLGLFRTALLAQNDFWVVVVVVGAVFLLSGINLGFFHRWKRKRVLEISSRVQIRRIAWFLGFILLGTALIQEGVNWFAILGIICLIIAYIILGAGIGADLWTIIRGIFLRPSKAGDRQGGITMGTKGRKNVKKSKQQKEKKK